jgi:glycosyltransferase involved in cell wall biosynthesis
VRILLITSSLPYPPTSGGALRAYGILHGLAHAGHELTLLSFHEGEQYTGTPLTAMCARIVTVPLPQRSKLSRLRDLLLTRHADIARRLDSAEFRLQLSQLLSQTHYDLVQFEGIEVACYLSDVRRLSPHSKCIFDTFNAEAELQRAIYHIDRAKPRRWHTALYSWLQVARIVRYERALCQQADAVITVSAEDYSFLSAYREDANTFILSSGIFVSDYQSADVQDLGAGALVFSGKMDYRPNVDAMLWFTESILPQLEHVHLTIVGQKPAPSIRALAHTGKVQVTGFVESVAPYLRGAQVYIAPLRMGSGTRLKLLEAMACGCAIVATPLAAAGLSDSALRSMRIALNSTDFAAAIRDLLADPVLRAKLGAQAQAAVRAEYDWSALVPRLLKIYNEVGLG